MSRERRLRPTQDETNAMFRLVDRSIPWSKTAQPFRRIPFSEDKIVRVMDACMTADQFERWLQRWDRADLIKVYRAACVALEVEAS